MRTQLELQGVGLRDSGMLQGMFLNDEISRSLGHGQFRGRGLLQFWACTLTLIALNPKP